MICVYKHLTKDTNEIFYIGIGNNKRPYIKHRRNNFWKNIVDKHDYIVEILYENLTWEEACNIEINLIKHYGRRDLGLGPLVNLTNGGEWKPQSLESKSKISNFNKNKKLSKETCLKMSNSRTGINRSPKTKLKISLNHGKSKKVIDTSTNTIYNSIIEASNLLNINYITLKRYLSGKRYNKTTLKYLNYE